MREGIIVGHVGDSRVYRIRDSKLEQLTEDHSPQRLPQDAQADEEEIANFPHKNVIVRALRDEAEVVKVDARVDQPHAGDIFLLCSDGLSGPVSDPELLRIVEENKSDLKTAASASSRRPTRTAAPDSITCCLVRWLGAAN